MAVLWNVLPAFGPMPWFAAESRFESVFPINIMESDAGTEKNPSLSCTNGVLSIALCTLSTAPGSHRGAIISMHSVSQQRLLIASKPAAYPVTIITSLIMVIYLISYGYDRKLNRHHSSPYGVHRYVLHVIL